MTGEGGALAPTAGQDAAAESGMGSERWRWALLLRGWSGGLGAGACQAAATRERRTTPACNDRERPQPPRRAFSLMPHPAHTYSPPALALHADGCATGPPRAAVQPGPRRSGRARAAAGRRWAAAAGLGSLPERWVTAVHCTFKCSVRSVVVGVSRGHLAALHTCLQWRRTGSPAASSVNTGYARLSPWHARHG